MILRAAFLALALAVPMTPAAAVPMVFFDLDSDRLSAQAKAILDSLAYQARTSAFSIVRLTGSADRSGSAAYNRALSLRRAKRVRAYLAARGVPPAPIELVALGESQPMVETDDGVPEPQNRYVLLEFALSPTPPRPRG